MSGPWQSYSGVVPAATAEPALAEEDDEEMNATFHNLTGSAVAVDLPSVAWTHAEELDEVKRAMGINHPYFDHWIYAFLENKRYDVDETISKLYRRSDMELNEMANYEVDEWMDENLRAGTIQIIGEDKDGRVIFYIVTCRDFPTSDRRQHRKKNCDMWMSYGTRLRKGNFSCKVCLLINQRDAGIWANTDLTFQSNTAIRLSKYFPGMVERSYVCCMGTALAAVARPIIGKLPKGIRDTTFVFTEKEIMEEGKLLPMIDRSVIPVALGGANDCDHPKYWSRFADNVLGYFRELQFALRAGKGVKEYELELLMKVDAEEEKRRREEQLELQQKVTAAENAERLMDQASTYLYSCPSAAQSDVCPPLRLEDELMSAETSSTQRGFSLEPPLGGESSRYFIEDQEDFLRQNLGQMEEMHRVGIGELFAIGHRTMQQTEETGQGQGGEEAQRLAMSCHGPLRPVVRGFLWTVCILTSLYFFFSTVIIASVTGSVIVLMFLASFIQPYFLLPMGLSILLAAHQGCLLSTRGFEMVHGSFKGVLFRPLRALGKYGMAVQTLFFVLLLLTQVMAFAVYASYYDPLSALSVGFAAGWVPCMVIVLLFHLLFPFGLHGEDSSDEEAGDSGGSLSLYLFFNVTERLETSSKEKKAISGMILVVPVVISFLIGVGFILTQQLAFLIASITVTFVSAFGANFAIGGSVRNHTNNVVRSAVWILTIQWLFTQFVLGFMDFHTGFAQAVIISLVVILVLFALIGFLFLLRPSDDSSPTSLRADDNASRKQRMYLHLLRANYFYLAVLLVIGVALSFVVNWGFGLLALALMIHSALCLVNTSSVRTFGRLVTILTTTMIVLTVILLGYSADAVSSTTLNDNSTTERVAAGRGWFLDVSMASSISSEGSGLSPAERNVSDFIFSSTNNDGASRSQQLFPQNGELQMPTVCQRHWELFSKSQSMAQLSVLDMALLANFPTLSLDEMQFVMREWFQHSEVPVRYLGYLRRVGDKAGQMSAGIPRFPILKLEVEETAASTGADGSAPPVVLVVANPPGIFASVRTMAMWVESLSFTPLSLVLPASWTIDLLRAVAFMHKLVPFEWLNALDMATQTVSDVQKAHPASTVLLTGQGLGGSVASVIGSQLSLPTVAFTSPGVFYSQGKFSVDQQALRRYVTSVLAESAALSSVDYHGVLAQSVPCAEGPVGCQDPLFLICHFLEVCTPAVRRKDFVCRRRHG